MGILDNWISLKKPAGIILFLSLNGILLSIYVYIDFKQGIPQRWTYSIIPILFSLVYLYDKFKEATY